MGIGGGLVFTIYNASNGKVETINARETAPMSATADMFDNDPQKQYPGLLIAVPGELRGYEMAHKRYGRLPWKELFVPSIKLASEGFKIGKALANAINDEKEKILKNAALREVFCDSHNTTLKENDTISFPQLAATYRKIAKNGANAFYNGSLTQTLVNDINAAGGNITREDLKDYKPELTEYALNFTVGRYTFYAPTAPFGGPVLALIMKILLGFGFSKKSVSTTENKTLTYHRIIEAFCLSNALKNNLSDPRYDKSVTELIKNMTSDSFADDTRRKIKDNTASACNKLLDDNDDNGTSHVSVLDKDGYAVAVTSSINNYFGSGVMSGSSGIIFNDQMSDFIQMKSERNKIEGGKRPLSSMCPTIILDKGKGKGRKVRMVVGAEGGMNITTSVVQVILNYLYFGYDLKNSVDQPRFHITPIGTYVDDNFNETVIKGLEKKNHTIIRNDTEDSVVQAIGKECTKICAASDFRKYGKPAGY
ncbi:glutathione hydrolase 1 proenzyme-like [Danio aesculapii]|uniref:glutathione hydrolase 1 proenzyme-like n=1 Tax=Danio aesculapii TaxID=1142201 RepID=UPI0024BF72ED|nr:glutathione hydrolase 1 proenzyme-like [Danio aesculapii]